MDKLNLQQELFDVGHYWVDEELKATQEEYNFVCGNLIQQKEKLRKHIEKEQQALQQAEQEYKELSTKQFLRNEIENERYHILHDEILRHKEEIEHCQADIKKLTRHPDEFYYQLGNVQFLLYGEEF